MPTEHAFKDYVCHTHQTLASECGCLEAERAIHCPRCGLDYQVLCGQHICLCCEYDYYRNKEKQITLELEGE